MNTTTTTTTDEIFTISSKETLLPLHQPSSPPSTKKYRKRIFISSLILLIIIACSIILASICKNKKHEKKRSKNHYCYLTKYPDLCYDSMSTSLIESNPSSIFSDSIKIAIDQLNNTTISITKALSSNKNSSKLLDCEKSVNRSVSQLNESMSAIGVDSDVYSLTDLEMDGIRARGFAAIEGANECLLGLKGEMGIGVEEVKVGVEIARKNVVNSVWLMNRRDYVHFEFYNVESDHDSYYYDSYRYDSFGSMYLPLVGMYAAMYLFLALLYILFWRTD